MIGIDECAAGQHEQLSPPELLKAEVLAATRKEVVDLDGRIYHPAVMGGIAIASERPGTSWFPPPGQDPFTDPPVSPLVLDLDGDGLDLIDRASSHAYFDLDANGFAEHTAWIGSDDSLLARDLNGNGRIDDRTELFGATNASTAQSVNGFTELAALDSNGDGQIDSADSGFNELVIWRDGDGDGLTNGGELHRWR